MMSYKKFALALLVTIPLISGCGLISFDDTENKKKEVEHYNKMVEGTLDSYAKYQLMAEKEKENMLKFVTQDSEWSYLEGHDLESLTLEEVDAFKLHDIIYDEYFTALGASAVREVVTISGFKHTMYVTIIWGKEGVLSIERKVKKNEK